MLKRALRKPPSHFPAVGWLGGRYGSSTVLRKPPSYQSVLLLLLLLISVDLAPPGTRLNTGDSFKSKTGVDNKRHTNAHQPLTSHSPTGVSIPPSPPLFKNAVNMRLFVPCYYFLLCSNYLYLSF